MNLLPSDQLGAPVHEKDHQLENVEDGDNCMCEDIAFEEAAQERLMQEGLGLSSPQMKAKGRKTGINEVHGGRIIRSTGRKDRHSKVCTAKGGTRDRRVRLSPNTAILFYDVQDRLGYDRPSKAIDWLMKEAKAAIDALDEPPPPATNVAEIHGPTVDTNELILKTESGMIQNVKHLDDDYPISSSGFFTEPAAPSYDDFNSSISRSEEQFLSAPLATPTSEIFDTNFEVARLQRIFSWNYSSVSTPPLHFPAPADLGHSHIFSEREPLQSSYSRITTNCPPQFPGVGFPNEEMLNFTAAATFKEDEMDNIPVSSKSFSTASFLHYEQ